MSNIINNKIWINDETCLTMAESIESFVDIYGEYVYDKKGSDNIIIISGLGRIHLPSTESYPLYFKGTDSDPHVCSNYYICSKEEYADAVNQQIDMLKKELKYYEELLSITGGKI